MRKSALLLAIILASIPATAQNDADNRLWYDRPANIWLEALPIGNSHLGGMIYGGTDAEQIQLNEETFWSGGPPYISLSQRPAVSGMEIA